MPLAIDTTSLTSGATVLFLAANVIAGELGRSGRPSLEAAVGGARRLWLDGLRASLGRGRTKDLGMTRRALRRGDCVA